MSLAPVKSKYHLLRTERLAKSDGGTRIIYVLQCPQCNEAELRIRKADWDQGKRTLCCMCSQRKRPFESIFNGLKNDWRKTQVQLTYEEFMTFTTQSECVYCKDNIPWTPYGVIRNQFMSRAYFLDRIDHSGPYSLRNCVVACTRCNRLRSDRFSFEEFCLIGQVLNRIDLSRKTARLIEKGADLDSSDELIPPVQTTDQKGGGYKSRPELAQPASNC